MLPHPVNASASSSSGPRGTGSVAARCGELRVAGLGSAPDNGLKRGVVVNIDATVDSVRRAVEDAELMAGVGGAHARPGGRIDPEGHEDAGKRQEGDDLAFASTLVRLGHRRTIAITFPNDMSAPDPRSVWHFVDRLRSANGRS